MIKRGLATNREFLLVPSLTEGVILLVDREDGRIWNLNKILVLYKPPDHFKKQFNVICGYLIVGSWVPLCPVPW